MNTVKFELIPGSPETKGNGSSAAQSRAVPTQLNIFAWGMSKPEDFQRLHEIITNSELMFQKELKELPNEITS